jgi:peroxiredoxin Q/BCP
LVRRGRPSIRASRLIKGHVDAAGQYVTPGLVDLHTHVYRGVTFWSIDVDAIAWHTRVSTRLDVGSSGAFTCMAFSLPATLTSVQSYTVRLDWSASWQLGDVLVSFRRTKDNVEVGSIAPDFTLPSQSEEMVNLKDFLGNKPVVLFFYPKDNTLGCTKEACAFRDSFEEFRKLGAEVIGISSDSVESHRSFAKKHDLPFTLLSDEEGKVRSLYGVPNTLGLFPGRVTYVIDREGVVRHLFSSQLGFVNHVEEALEILRCLG